MASHRLTDISRRVLALGAASAALVVAPGCSDSGYPRGQFTGYVMDKTEDEVADKAGKPDSTEKVGAERLKWVYRKKTFNPDNQNKPDVETVLTFKRDADTGKMKVESIDFL
ncbi:hypothetical protein [Usitatibacter palustris]|uniref:Uncharacterized protein n=1 Tax=Usitatibacter palustris TaxID=2732487 RepID=A0A6M4H662_9PROT|nr:hypothetical protein [Usitatibacter palustris]QJR14428.1 hypothetical protein DSM104440_01224 [Usitatibacter palustris]